MAVVVVILFCIALGVVIYFSNKCAKWLDRKRYEEQRELYRNYMVDKLQDDMEAFETFRQMCAEADKRDWR